MLLDGRTRLRLQFFVDDFEDCRCKRCCCIRQPFCIGKFVHFVILKSDHADKQVVVGHCGDSVNHTMTRRRKFTTFLRLN